MDGIDTDRGYGTGSDDGGCTLSNNINGNFEVGEFILPNGFSAYHSKSWTDSKRGSDGGDEDSPVKRFSIVSIFMSQKSVDRIVSTRRWTRVIHMMLSLVEIQS